MQEARERDVDVLELMAAIIPIRNDIIRFVVTKDGTVFRWRSIDLGFRDSGVARLKESLRTSQFTTQDTGVLVRFSGQA